MDHRTGTLPRSPEKEKERKSRKNSNVHLFDFQKALRYTRTLYKNYVFGKFLTVAIVQ